MKAVVPKISKAFVARMKPAPRPARVAPSKRAEALPRRTSLPAVATAMKPRIEGIEAAVEAPWRRRAPPRTPRLAVRGMRRTGAAPRAAGVGGEGQERARGRAEARAIQHAPPMSPAIGQDAEERRQGELGHEERGGQQADRLGVDAGDALRRELGEVGAEHRPGQAGRETKGERAGQDVP